MFIFLRTLRIWSFVLFTVLVITFSLIYNKNASNSFLTGKASSPHFLSSLQMVSKSRDQHDDVVDVIILSSYHIWQSLLSIPHIALEIQNLVIFYSVYNLYPSHVTGMMILWM